jgi:HTH-type transcriptional regulator, competence development regulator
MIFTILVTLFYSPSVDRTRTQLDDLHVVEFISLLWYKHNTSFVFIINRQGDAMADLTPFGKAARKIRIDRSETLGDMADALGISAAFLSSMETGKRNIPDEMVEKIVRYFDLKGTEANELRRLAMESRNTIKLKPTGKNRQLATAFARKFEELDKTQIEEILRVLNKAK